MRRSRAEACPESAEGRADTGNAVPLLRRRHPLFEQSSNEEEDVASFLDATDSTTASEMHRGRNCNETWETLV